MMISRSTLLLISIIVILVLCYLYFAGFPPGITNKLQSALAEHGMQARISKLYLNPLRGLIAEDVYFLDPLTGRTLTSVSEVQLSFSIWRLIKRENPVTSLEAKNVELSFPIDPEHPSEGVFSITDTHAIGHFTGKNTLVIDSLNGIAAGVRFNLEAKLILNPLPFKKKVLSEEDKKSRLILRKKIFGILKQIKFNHEPDLKVIVSGDLSNIHSWKAEAVLRANNLILQNVNIDSVDFLLKLQDSVLTLEKFSFSTSSGSFSATGYKHLEEPYAQLNVVSDFDFTLFSFELNPHLKRVLSSFEFFQRPQFSLTATQSGSQIGNWSVYGRLGFTSFTYAGTYFEKLDIPFALQNGELLIPQFFLKDSFGETKAKILYNLASTELTGELQGAINPLNFVNLVPKNYQKYFMMFTKVNTPLLLDVKAAGTTQKDPSFKISGTAIIKNCYLVNQSFQQISTDLDISGGKLRCYNALVVRKEGRGNGEIIYTFKDQLLQIINFKSQLYPLPIATVLGPKSVDAVKPYIFHQPPQATVNGYVDYVTGDKTDVLISINGQKIDYPMTKATLKFDRIQTKLRITQGKCQLTGFKSDIYKGTLEGNANFKFIPGQDTIFDMDMTIKSMSFQLLNMALFNYGKSTGSLNAHGKFNGGLGNWAKVDGKGHMDVTNGNLVSLPFLGPLSTLADAVIPGFASLQANKATCDFTMENGVVKTDQLDMSGGGWALICSGFYDIPQDHLKMDARINVRGIFGAITFLMSKLFEYEADGTFTNPKWKSKNF